MIQAIKEWYWFHRTAKARVERATKAAEFWMNETMTLERKYEEVQPTFVVVEKGQTLIPNDADYLGEFPPLDVA